MLELCATSEGVFKPEYRRQLLASMCITIMTFAHGFGLGWFSVILVKLESPTETALDFVLTVNQASWIGGLTSLGSAAGNIIYGLVVDFVGRKASIYSLAVPYMVSWVLIYFAKSFEYFYACRFLSGISGGGIYVVLPIFIAEISEPNIRGRLSSLFSLTLYSGVFVGYIITARLPYHTVPILGLGLPTIFLILQIFLPETPTFLLQRGLDARAKQSLMFYRNFQATSTENVSKFQIEFENLKTAVAISHNTSKSNVSWRDFCNKRAAIAFANSFVLMSLNVFCGIYVMLYYTSTIFVKTPTSLDPDTNTIIVGFVQVTGVYMATILVDKFGRKPLLIFSCAATCFGMTTFGLYGFLLQHTSVDLSAVNSWLPLINVCLIVFVGNLGLMPIPFILLVELMPSKIRAKASAISLVVLNVLAFVLYKMFPLSLEEFGLFVPLCLFAVTCLLGLIYVIIFIKETKGMSLNEVKLEA